MDDKNLYKSFFNEMEYWGTKAAGVLFLSKSTGRILLMFRSEMVNEGLTWGVIGGKLDGSESIEVALRREVQEETEYSGEIKLIKLYVFKDKNFEYHNYLGIVDEEFEPTLNWESDDYKWCNINDLPEPLHFGVEALLQHSGNKINQVIELIKKKKGNTPMTEAIDMPPAEIKKVDIFRPDFIEYMKSVENVEKAGFNNKLKKYFPIRTLSRVRFVIGYGHEIKQKGEWARFKNGITEAEAIKVLKEDIVDSYNKVIEYHNNWVNDYISAWKAEIKRNPANPNAKFFNNIKATDPMFKLSQAQIEMCIDIVFNIGGLEKFPKLANAIFMNDYKTIGTEYKRSYITSTGERKELVGRNTAFKSRFNIK